MLHVRARRSCIGEGADSLLQDRFIVALLSALILSGCAATRRYEASRTEEVKKTEAMPSVAGLRRIEIKASEQVGLAKDLAPHKINSYDVQSGNGLLVLRPGHLFMRV